MREDTPALIAYYYFDYKDTSKRDVRGLLAFKLAYDSHRCWDILHYTPSAMMVLNGPVIPPLSNVLKPCSGSQDYLLYSLSWMHWTSVRVTLERHPPVKRCWSLWRILLS